MIIRTLTQDGDWTFGKGTEDYASGSDAIAIAIETRLLSFLGDCFFDENAGVDWLSLLGSKNQAALIFSVRSIIQNTPGVSTLNALTTSVDSNRNLFLSYSVTTAFGTEVSAANFEVPNSPYQGISKFVRDLIFASSTTQDVDVSAVIPDARNAVWFLYDNDNGFAQVVGAVQPLNATTVRVTMVLAVTGTFRLVGIS